MSCSTHILNLVGLLGHSRINGRMGMKQLCGLELDVSHSADTIAIIIYDNNYSTDISTIYIIYAIVQGEFSVPHPLPAYEITIAHAQRKVQAKCISGGM